MIAFEPSTRFTIRSIQHQPGKKDVWNENDFTLAPEGAGTVLTKHLTGGFGPVIFFLASRAIKKDAMVRGLLCYPFGGTVDGRQGDHVLLAPPFIATRQDLQEIAVRLAASIDAVTSAAVR